MPPNNHAVFSTSHQPVLPVLESLLFQLSNRSFFLENLTGNSAPSFASDFLFAIDTLNFHQILRLYLCFLEILQEEVVVVVVKLDLADEGPMAHATV